MNLISVLQAKVIWLFDLNLLTSKGLSYTPLLRGIKDRYSFAKAPEHMLDVPQGEKGALFEQGQFATEDGRTIYVSLRVYTDGIVASTCSSTDDTTDFLEDLTVFTESMGFNIPSGQLSGKGFSSSLLVECDNDPLLTLNPKLKQLVSFIESRVATLDGKPREFQVSGFNLWTEDKGKSFAPTPFKFERRDDKPFDANQFYTVAPLQTDEHLELLEELEGILKP